jgi:hypothetical protein
MRRRLQPSTITSPPVDSRVLQFVSRADQLQLRGQRNYSRYMLLTKGFVAPDGPERAQWQRESAQDSQRDAEWNQRHGPIPGGARVVTFQPDTHGSASTARSSRAIPITNPTGA